ncbi:MAG: hypothetical protein M3209_19305 [Acidobacteriota bacterium]|nr:hypothetical protein [Acidobacteriota bacterium]
MMKKRFWFLLPVLLAAFILVWVYWQYPTRVEMAGYVPADVLVYFEGDDLPGIFQDFTATDAWRELAPQFGVRKDFGSFGGLSRFLANANLGSTETLVFGRSQVAVALMNVEAAGAEDALKIKPRYAVIIETKTTQSRAGHFVEKQIGAFARSQFNEASLEKLEREGLNWTIFRSVRDERRIFAAVDGGTIIFGNDETAIKSCFEAKNQLRPSLAQSPHLAEMRAETEAGKALVFGFVTNEGVRKLSQIGAVLFAVQIAEEPAAMSLIAQSLPPMIEKTVAGIGWTARAANGKIEDRYFFNLLPDFSARLKEPLAVSNQTTNEAANFLPAETKSVTTYNLKDAGAAWRGIVLAFSAKLDTLGAAAFAQVAGKLLEPYGVRQPNDFLSASGGELTTARLSEKENETVAIVKIGDANKMLATIEPASKENNRAAAFTNGMLLLGENEDVAKCLAARENSLANTDFWQGFAKTKLSANPPLIRTFSRDTESAAQFVRIFGDEKLKQKTPDLSKNQSLTISIAETSLHDNGFERRTLSPFGLIGTLTVNFAE